MATLTASRAASTFPVYYNGGGVCCVARGTYEIATNPTANDIIQMCKLPANSTVFMGWVYGDDLDTGTEAMDMDVGWAANGNESADEDGFGNLGVWTGDAITDLRPEVSIFYPFGGVMRTAGPQTFTAETTIQIDVNVAANAGGTGTLTVVALYDCA